MQSIYRLFSRHIVVSIILLFVFITTGYSDGSSTMPDIISGNFFAEGSIDFKAIAVDKSAKTAYLLKIENDTPVIIKRYTDILTGEVNGDKAVEGDKKTPEGVYFTQSFIPKEKLTPTYGYGALPLNYPNFYDRILGKTGHGIWIHGVDDSIEDNSTEGCVALKNGNMKDLVSQTDILTPVVIAEKLRFLDKDSYVIEKNRWLNFIKGFIDAWEKGDMDKFQTYVHTRFKNADNQDIYKYLLEKKQLAKLYPYRKINIDNIRIFLENENEGMADFKQLYCASNIIVEGTKKLYISGELGENKIIGELFYPDNSFDMTKRYIEEFINAWSLAWQSKNIDKYKSFYGNSFYSSGMDLENWLKDKDEKFKKYDFIKIEIDNLQIKNISPNETTIYFRQKFAADKYSDTGIKELILKGCPGDFKIISETWRPL
ncbi:MAG: hypothetical protein JG767_1088 [Deferribacteraceae bacterium]|nr:hypothetical protein [Deferribacteraceae bacterium]